MEDSRRVWKFGQSVHNEFPNFLQETGKQLENVRSPIFLVAQVVGDLIAYAAYKLLRYQLEIIEHDRSFNLKP